MKITNIKKQDLNDVLHIYMQGIQTGCATFQTEALSPEEWDQAHLPFGRLKAIDDQGHMLGFVALSPTSSRCAYRGVAEVSIYIATAARGQGIGKQLLEAVIQESEQKGIWTLQSGIFEINEPSIALHHACGFRKIGYRERVAKDVNGVWRNVVLMEKRSSKDF